MRAKLTGLHKATKKLSGGRVAIYAYAYRGGGVVARVEAATLAAANKRMELELGRRETLDRIEKARRPIRVTDSKKHVRGLIYAFKASPEWAKLGDASKVEYERYLRLFDEEFGDWKVNLFEQAEAKTDLLDWRDDHWSDKPRAADYAMGSVGRLFKWARGRGLTTARPTDDVERLHDVDRSDVIWTDDELKSLLTAAGKEVGWAIKLAAETGLRLGDLIKLPWGAVGQHGIVWRTGKSSGRRQIVVPLTPAAKALLKEIPRTGLVILTNTLGKSWTQDGFKTMFRRARLDAGIEGRRLHDLRGTAATRLFLAGSPKRDIATILGWSEETVDALLTKYVSGDAVALDLVSRMNQKRAAQTGHKPGSPSDG